MFSAKSLHTDIRITFLNILKISLIYDHCRRNIFRFVICTIGRKIYSNKFPPKSAACNISKCWHTHTCISRINVTFRRSFGLWLYQYARAVTSFNVDACTIGANYSQHLSNRIHLNFFGCDFYKFIFVCALWLARSDGSTVVSFS